MINLELTPHEARALARAAEVRCEQLAPVREYVAAPPGGAALELARSKLLHGLQLAGEGPHAAVRSEM
jgi:hypothetical protein